MPFEFFNAAGAKVITDTVAAINSIGDVVITTPADNEVLAYDNGSGNFINQTAAEAALATDDHNHGTNGVITLVDTSDVSSPPTDAELDSAFGTPATVGAGFTALVDDNGAGSAVWLVASDGTNWHYVALTAAV